MVLLVLASYQQMICFITVFLCTAVSCWAKEKVPPTAFGFSCRAFLARWKAF